MLQFMSEGSEKTDGPVQGNQTGGIFFYFRRVSLFFLFSPSIAWLRTLYIRESNLLYSICQFKCYFYPKTPAHTHPE
jgi:hypothetical protein